MNTKPIIGPIAVCVLLVSTGVAELHAETVYVTDMLRLNLHETPEMDTRAIRSLRSGDRLDVLDRMSSRAKVRTEDGTTGWVKSLYLVQDEPARTRVNSLEDQNKRLQKDVESLSGRLGSAEAQLNDATAEQSAEMEKIESERVELETLREQNASLSSRLDSYGYSLPLRWMLLALLAAIVGGFAGGFWFLDRRIRSSHGGFRVY